MLYSNNQPLTAEFSTAIVPLVFADISPDPATYEIAILRWPEALTDAEALSRVEGVTTIYRDDGVYLTAYAVGPQCLIRHEEAETAVWLRMTGETVAESPVGLQRQITDADLALMAAQQQVTEADLNEMEGQA